MTLIVKRPVVLKNVVTESFKTQITAELTNAIDQIDRWLDQEEFQSRRLLTEAERFGQRRVQELQHELWQERDRQEQIRANLQQQLQEVDQLELNSLFTNGTYDSPVKIEVGDSIHAKLRQAEIVVKDGIVIRIVE